MHLSAQEGGQPHRLLRRPEDQVAAATDMNTRPIENSTWSRWLAL